MKALLVLSAAIAITFCQRLDNASCEVYDCTKCYNLLVYNVLKSDRNLYNMHFLSTSKANPVLLGVGSTFEVGGPFRPHPSHTHNHTQKCNSLHTQIYLHTSLDLFVGL